MENYQGSSATICVAKLDKSNSTACMQISMKSKYALLAPILFLIFSYYTGLAILRGLSKATRKEIETATFNLQTASWYMSISQKNLQFLQQLSQNNNREWFDAHKPEFQGYQEEFKAFHREVLHCLKGHDDIARNKTFRIYRDVRFSKDKTPFKSHWSGSFNRATEELRGGYYYQIAPERSQVIGGFFGPNPQDLLHLRKQISQDSEPLQEVLESEAFKKSFGSLQGKQVKTAPKGFSKDDPTIELLRFKQFLVYVHFTDEEVMRNDFAEKISDSFKAMRPYFDVMSMYLTTDLNGIPIV